MFADTLIRLSEAVRDAYRERHWMVATAESCTGGLIAGALTAVAGSSAIVDRGFVTYTNAAKTQVLGVPEDVLADQGAVSEAVARAMAAGALARSDAAVAIAVTGVAGPGGGSAEKPVGLVHFARSQQGAPVFAEHLIFDGDRATVRAATVEHALRLLLGAADV